MNGTVCDASDWYVLAAFAAAGMLLLVIVVVIGMWTAPKAQDLWRSPPPPPSPFRKK